MRKTRKLKRHTEVSDYDWRIDAFQSYQHAIRMKALAIGSMRFQTPAEMYWQEQHGQIV